MYLTRFPFHLLSNFETCLILVHFSLLILSSPVSSSETRSMKNLQNYGFVTESRSGSATVINPKAVQKAMKVQRFSETFETDRQKREVETPKPDLCEDASIDAATTTTGGKTYVFKGDYYWELTGVENIRIVDGYPRKITEDWEGLPSNLDAALSWNNGKIFFFKGNMYWRLFENKTLVSGYPKTLSSGFSGIPSNVDAAFFWTKTWKTYFFKGSEYWQYNGPDQSPVSISYPLTNSTWEGLPNNIDAALQMSNKDAYFFKEKSFYRFNDKLTSVAKDDPSGPHPRSTAVWFGCQGQSTSNQDFTTVSLNGADMHPAFIDEDDDISSSIQPHQNGDDLTTPSSWDELVITDSAASSFANLLLSLLMVAILWTH